jgi:hypothetical protein
MESVKNPKDIMRGVGQTYGCVLEFEGETPRVFSRIVWETLPPARQCGMSAKRGVFDAKYSRLINP